MHILLAIIIHILTISEINFEYQKHMMMNKQLPNKWVSGFAITGKEECHIFVPPITDEYTLDIYLHEVKHCYEGSWHK